MSYTKTNWSFGDIITSEKLNKIENGIAEAAESGGGSFIVHLVEKAPEISGGGGGGGGVVIKGNTKEVSINFPYLALDKTFAEIQAAVEAGMTVILVPGESELASDEESSGDAGERNTKSGQASNSGSEITNIYGYLQEISQYIPQVDEWYGHISFKASNQILPVSAPQTDPTTYYPMISYFPNDDEISLSFISEDPDELPINYDIMSTSSIARILCFSGSVPRSDIQFLYNHNKDIELFIQGPNGNISLGFYAEELTLTDNTYMTTTGGAIFVLNNDNYSLNIIYACPITLNSDTNLPTVSPSTVRLAIEMGKSIFLEIEDNNEFIYYPMIEWTYDSNHELASIEFSNKAKFNVSNYAWTTQFNEA